MYELDQRDFYHNGQTVCNCCGSAYNDAQKATVTTTNPGIRIVRHPKKTMRPTVKVTTRNGVLGLYLKAWEE